MSAIRWLAADAQPWPRWFMLGVWVLLVLHGFGGIMRIVEWLS